MPKVRPEFCQAVTSTSLLVVCCMRLQASNKGELKVGRTHTVNLCPCLHVPPNLEVMGNDQAEVEAQPGIHPVWSWSNKTHSQLTRQEAKEHLIQMQSLKCPKTCRNLQSLAFQGLPPDLRKKGLKRALIAIQAPMSHPPFSCHAPSTLRVWGPNPGFE